MIKISAMALLVVLAMTGCKKSYTITVKSNNAEWGSVTGGGNYKDGETATIFAIPKPGYYFIAWNDGNMENPRQILVSGNAEFIATFSDTPGGGGGTDNAVTVSGSISSNTTWPDCGAGVDYIIEGRFYVEGNALLTIQPGVTIMFTDVNGGIFVEENAGLCMKGTANNHIVLTGPTNNQNKGAWNSVIVTSNRNDNQFEYVDFFNGGSYEAPVVEVSGKISMKNCLVNGGLADGVSVDGSMSTFENNTIKNMNRFPLVLGRHQLANFLGTGNVFTNNTNNMINMTAFWLENTNSTETVKFTNQGIPYYFSEGIRTETAQDVMRVKEGVDMVFAYGKEILISEEGSIIVEGTENAPVTFRGLQNESGYWNGIIVESTRTNGANKLVNCAIKNAGMSDEAALSTTENCRITFTNVTISGSNGYGMSIAIPIDWDTEQYDFANYHVTASGLSFSNCTQGNIYERNKDQVYTTWPGNKKLARK